MNRRELIRNLMILAPLTGGWPWLAQSEEAVVRPRENIRGLSSDKLADFRRAVAILKARDATDKTSWFNLASIHGVPPATPEKPGHGPISGNSELWNQCHKDEGVKNFPTFLIWHRFYVRCLEAMLGAALKDSSFRLPYWDWHADPSLPEVFRNPFVDNQLVERNPLFHDRRRPEINCGVAVWTPWGYTDFHAATFDKFQETLLNSEHRSIHDGCGGDMSEKFTAAHDPIFLLHHANVDRLLMVWRNQDMKSHVSPPDFDRWKKLNYRFVSPQGDIYTPEVSAAELDSLTPMGYTYWDLAVPNVPAPKLIAIGQTVITAATEPGTFALNGIIAAKSQVRIGPAGTLVFELAGQDLLRAKEQIAKPNGEVDLVLTRIRKDQSFDGVPTYQLFLALPPQPGAGARFREHYLGSIDFFGMSRCGAAEESCTPQYFPLAEKIRTLLPNRVDLKSIRISFVPVVSPGAKAPSVNDVVLQIAGVDLRVPFAGSIQ